MKNIINLAANSKVLNRILIIQTASIGDVILATPLIESFAEQQPPVEIDFLLKKGCESLFEGHPYIREVMVWDKSEKKYAHLFALLKTIRKRKYDHVFNLQRFASSGFLTVFSKALNTVGFDKNPFSFLYKNKVRHIIGTGTSLHEIDRNLMLIENIVEPKRQIKLYPNEADIIEVQQYKNKPYICIAPASLWETKKFPEKKWLEFLNSLPEDLAVFLIGSKNDEELCNNLVKKSVKPSVSSLAGKLSLLQTAALLKDAKMNFTNDSAPQHLASAVNAPVAGIFCSTVPSFGFGPLSERSFIIETQENLGCRPCGIHGFKSCPEKHFKCATTITNNQLLFCYNS
ncbi:MAG TPA: glycosyltransferase family 9 protein [Bacteroidales bacterium]|nr:glycosyltransferase family 9 protein [Bacteroidales bacterium]